MNVIDNMTLHDASCWPAVRHCISIWQTCPRENYRVSVLHERENNVPVDQAVDPINELTVAFTTSSSMRWARQGQGNCSTSSNSTPSSRRTPLRPVPAVEGKIRRVSGIAWRYKRLGGSDKKECLRRLYNEIDALFRTSPIALKKPTPVEGSGHDSRHLRQHAVQHHPQGLPSLRRLGPGR